MRKGFLIFLLLGFVILLAACNGEQSRNESTAPTMPTATTATTSVTETTQPTVATTEQITSIPETQNSVTESAQIEAVQQQTQNNNEEPEYEEEQLQELQTETLQMLIGGTPVAVAWEDNDAVQALRELCKDQPLTIYMSMYGGFEQVGSIGSDFPQNDVQTTTSAGDIVLYSGNQMVVFYGSNTWAYTPLGHITDKTTEELTALLSNGDVTITLTY